MQALSFEGGFPIRLTVEIACHVSQLISKSNFRRQRQCLELEAEAMMVVVCRKLMFGR